MKLLVCTALLFSASSVAWAQRVVTLPLNVMTLPNAVLLMHASDGVRQVVLRSGVAPTGRSVTYMYHVGPGTAPTRVVEAYRSWLTRQGYSIVGTDHAIGHIMRRCSELIDACGSWSREFTFAFDAGRSMVLQKRTPQGMQYAAVYANQVERPLSWDASASRVALRDTIDFNRGEVVAMLTLVTPSARGAGMVEEDGGIRQDRP